MTAPGLFLMTLIGISGIICGDGLLDDNLQINLTQTVDATNGHTRYELTCAVTGVVGMLDFGWIGVPCQSGAQTSTCTFAHDSVLDNIRPTCTAVLRDSGQTTATRFIIDITYPHLQVSRSDVPGVNILQTGDVVTCMVPTQNTLVGSVQFACTDPQLYDKPDVINGTSVSSSVTVNAAHATENDATCVCDATFDIGGGHYHITTAHMFTIGHKAIVKSLTMNTTDKEITVTGSDHATLNMVCEAFGRPTPATFGLQKDGKETSLAGVTVTGVGKWSKQAAVTLSDIQCRDMGTYSCTARNGLGHPDIRSIMLNVRCPPRTYFDQLLMMARQGITFTLEAYPIPDKSIDPIPDMFDFIYHGNQTGNDGRRVSSNRFSSYCQQHQVQTFMSICVIAPVDVPKDHLGYYTASLSNSLDMVNVSFCINTEVVEGKTPMVWTVVGTTAAVVVAVLITIIIVVARRRCQACGTPQPLRNEITGFHEEVELNPIRRQRQQSDQSHQDSDDDIPQPQLPPAGVPISGARSRQMSEEENQYTRISDSSSLSYEHAYDMTERRGNRDEHFYTDPTRP